MKNQKLFDRTIGILVNAYLNGVLNYADCAACAVGNLIAANCNYKIVKSATGSDCYDWIGCHVKWGRAIYIGEGIPNELGGSESIEQIKKSGYSVSNAAKIEFAFYKGCIHDGKYFGTDEENFKGLMSVCDTLMQIHEASKEEITEAKRLFVKEPA